MKDYRRDEVALLKDNNRIDTETIGKEKNFKIVTVKLEFYIKCLKQKLKQ